MSEDSHSNGSRGSLKGFKSLFAKKPEQSAPLGRYDNDNTAKKIGNVLGFGQSKKEDYSPGVPSLDRNGYEKFNVYDSEIYISKPQMNALFDNDEPTMIRATYGNRVGATDGFATREADVSAAKAPDYQSIFAGIATGSSEVKVYGGNVVGLSETPNTPSTFLHVEYEEPQEDVSMEPEALKFESFPGEESEHVDTVYYPVDEPETQAPAEEEHVDTVYYPAEAALDAEDVHVDETALEAEVPVEEPVFEAPAEEPAVEAEELVTPVEETFVEAEIPVEEPVFEMPIEAEAAEEPVVEVPAEPISVVATLASAEVAAQTPEVVGSYLEGNEPIQESVVDESVAAPAVEPAAATATSAAAVAPMAHNLDFEGRSILPPMNTDTVAKSRVRFKFINGVLTKVVEEPAESNEGLRVPFESAVGQTVERIGPAISKKEPEAEIPLWELEITDELLDDAADCATITDGVVESLAFDACPPAVIADLVDLMPLSHPEMDVSYDWAVPACEDDGMDAEFFAEPAVFEVGEVPAMICAPAATLTLAAPADRALLCAAPAVAEAVESIVNGVVFSFGSGRGQGRVSFSFGN